MLIRRATDLDYTAFTELFPELLVDDPLPSAARWNAEIGPQTWIAEDGEVLGYCYVQVLQGAGYVRHLVTAPAARRRGVGRALLEHVVRVLRDAGATAWHLNVKPDNTAARALYEALGMRPTYEATALRLSWEGWATIDAANVRVAPVTDDAEAETVFQLPGGQLQNARAAGRLVLGAWGEGMVGLAVYDPGFPGSFPFRARSPGVARALAEGIHAVATTSNLQFVVEADPVLVDAALAAGATVRLRALHYEGAL